MKDRLYRRARRDPHQRARKSSDVEILFSIIKRKDLDKAVKIIEECQSNAFYSIEDAKSVKQAFFPPKKRKSFAAALRRLARKGK
jgi:hypothetical protein